MTRCAPIRYRLRHGRQTPLINDRHANLQATQANVTTPNRALLAAQIHAKGFLDAAHIRMLDTRLLSELLPLRDRVHDVLDCLVCLFGFQPHVRSKYHEVAVGKIVSLSRQAHLVIAGP